MTPLRPLMKSMHAPIYASRLRVLVSNIVPHLRPGDRVLDVGCGVGTLGAAILAHPSCPAGVTVSGLERRPRGGEPIEVVAYGGGRFPFEDRAFDAVIIADVLHHEEKPEDLLDECARVAGRLLIVKDHQVRGVLGRQRICLIDWAANAPHGVRCLYRYNTPAEWARAIGRLPFRPARIANGMKLYPPIVDQVFGGRLQYMAVLERAEGDRTT